MARVLPRRELPRREIDPKTELLYVKKEPEIFNKKNIRNSTRAGGKPRNPLPDGHPQLPQFEVEFKRTVDDLKNLDKFGWVFREEGEVWKARTARARGDLPGFWNDVKVE